jgi:hypothetical protein
LDRCPADAATRSGLVGATRSRGRRGFLKHSLALPRRMSRARPAFLRPAQSPRKSSKRRLAASAEGSLPPLGG